MRQLSLDRLCDQHAVLHGRMVVVAEHLPRNLQQTPRIERTQRSQIGRRGGIDRRSELQAPCALGGE